MRWDNNLILASFVILVVIEIFYLPCMWLPTKQNRYFRALLVATLVIRLSCEAEKLQLYRYQSQQLRRPEGHLR
jgi:hypothetical protein